MDAKVSEQRVVRYDLRVKNFIVLLALLFRNLH